MKQNFPFGPSSALKIQFKINTIKFNMYKLKKKHLGQINLNYQVLLEMLPPVHFVNNQNLLFKIFDPKCYP